MPEGSALCFHHLSVGPQGKWKEKAAAVRLYIFDDIPADTELCSCGQHWVIQSIFTLRSAEINKHTFAWPCCFGKDIYSEEKDLL